MPVSVEGKIHSHPLDNDETFHYTFGQAGTFKCYCSVHPRMIGTVVVVK